MGRRKLLGIGDGVTPTGFARVMHSILGNLSKRKYDIQQIGINYFGDPHDYNWKIYPAALGGDVYGINRLPTFADKDIDVIFMVNDLFIINDYLKKIKETWKKIPKIVAYFPIDALRLDADWFENFDIVTHPVAYTEFGYGEVKKVRQI